jgi:xanthine dehydrogenase YagT iron-sulfur-binding subunit
MLKEAQAGMPIAVTLATGHSVAAGLTEDEIRERMAGNLCRCGAYVGIVAAIQAVDQASADRRRR